MVAGAMFAACNQAAKEETKAADSTATTEAAAVVAPADSTMHTDSTATAPATEEKH
ncbi:MAG: hypothetical protein RIQ33_1758 [Bacteroidota bacterium]